MAADAGTMPPDGAGFNLVLDSTNMPRLRCSERRVAGGKGWLLAKADRPLHWRGGAWVKHPMSI
jgi:hypothetical protein